MHFFEYSFCLQFMHFLPVYSLCPLWLILLPVPFNSSVFAITVSVSVYWITVSCVSCSPAGVATTVPGPFYSNVLQ